MESRFPSWGYLMETMPVAHVAVPGNEGRKHALLLALPCAPPVPGVACALAGVPDLVWVHSGPGLLEAGSRPSLSPQLPRGWAVARLGCRVLPVLQPPQGILKGMALQQRPGSCP